jgi:hypothetical protein
MSTIYEYNMHDLGQSTFQSIQNQALREGRAKALEDQAEQFEKAARSEKDPARRAELLKQARDARKFISQVLILGSGMGQTSTDSTDASAPSPPATATTPAATAAAATPDQSGVLNNVLTWFSGLNTLVKVGIGAGLATATICGVQYYRKRSAA